MKILHWLEGSVKWYGRGAMLQVACTSYSPGRAGRIVQRGSVREHTIQHACEYACMRVSTHMCTNSLDKHYHNFIFSMFELYIIIL
jgi:hypothetical protein